MTPFDQLVARLKKDCGLEVTGIHRTYISKQQKESWSWSWIGEIKGTRIRVGSWMTVQELLSSKSELKSTQNKWLDLEVLATDV